MSILLTDVEELSEMITEDIVVILQQYYLEYPKGNKETEGVLELHTIGKAAHFDMRFSVNDHLIGYSIVGFNVDMKPDVNTFEIGKGYFPETPEVDRVDERLFLCFAAMGEFENPYWSRERENFRFAHLKGITLRLLESLGWEPEFTPTQNCPYLHPGVAAEVTGSGRILGCIGELKPEIAETLKFADSLYLAEIRLDILFEKPLPQPQFKSLPRFPSVQRDFSFLLDRSIEYARIEKVVQELKISELSDFRLIDLYQDPNLSQDKYSLTVRLTFSSPDRTLTQEEVNDRFEKVSGVLCREFGIEPR